jgi:hypothetical protein
MSQTAEETELNVVNSSFMLKVFYVFAALALLSAGVSLAGKWLGASIAMAGHTDDVSPREVVIGNNVIAAPANAIRFERQRNNGVAARLDLYFRYPQMDGYSHAASADFNNAGSEKNIIFVSFEPRMMSRDMSGRFEPIYRSLIVEPGASGPAGLDVYQFSEKSGYLNEVLVVGGRGDDNPYVARCLTGASAEESLAPCERDIQLGDELSLSYRFPKEFLADWQRLDAAVLGKARQMLKE